MPEYMGGEKPKFLMEMPDGSDNRADYTGIH